jgi:lipopolysaccharide/colanic/teichoic acid biosynthesis glycosyltransferase
MNGAPFQILKFRTMTVMENGDVIKQAEIGDVRVTRVGAWMRRLSLDELPQLINVIAGDMSLIGPRPHALAHDRFYGREIAGYDKRQTVKPGISGWAQVHGHRGATVTVSRMRERLAYDVWYARNATLALDLEIVGRTIGEVLTQRNAY